MSFDQPYLLLGDSGEAVTRLQEDLTAVGCYFDVADGYFGEATQSAVTIFQEALGVAATGVVGSDTWGLLEGPDATENQSIDLIDFPALSMALNQGESPDVDTYLAALDIGPLDTAIA